MKEKKIEAKTRKFKKSTIVLSVILSIVILATSILGVVALFYQPKATINDGTINLEAGNAGIFSDKNVKKRLFLVKFI